MLWNWMIHVGIFDKSMDAFSHKLTWYSQREEDVQGKGWRLTCFNLFPIPERKTGLGISPCSSFALNDPSLPTFQHMPSIPGYFYSCLGTAVSLIKMKVSRGGRASLEVFPKALGLQVRSLLPLSSPSWIFWVLWKPGAFTSATSLCWTWGG